MGKVLITCRSNTIQVGKHYAESPDDPDGIYYGDVDFDGRKIDSDLIRLEQRVNGGQFADIWRGTLTDRNQKEIVAVKKLKSL